MKFGKMFSWASFNDDHPLMYLNVPFSREIFKENLQGGGTFEELYEHTKCLKCMFITLYISRGKRVHHR